LYVGVAVKRVEDEALLRGAGAYVDDLREPSLLHLAFVRSPYGHARVRSIDVDAARGLRGVVAVLTADDLDGATLPPPAGLPPGTRGASAPPLASDVVRYVAEPVVAVVAETRYLAEDAARLVDVEYDPLPAVGRIEDAIGPDAPLVHADAPGNVAHRRVHLHGDVDGLFARAARVVRVRTRRHRVAPVPLEPRGILVRPEPDGRYTAWNSTQSVHRTRAGIAQALGISEDLVRAIAPDVGGGFGAKTTTYREEVVVAAAARRLGRPVKWHATRMEDLQTTQHARDQLDEAEAAFDADGCWLALRLVSTGAIGAYLHGGNATLLSRMISYPTGAYRVQALRSEIRAVFTHANPTGAYRGAGRPEAATLAERIMDLAARELGIDPVEIRRRNFIRPSDFPYANPGGSTYDSGDYAALLDRALELADHGRLVRERDARRARGELVGIGLATFVEQTGAGWEFGRVRAASDGTVTAFTGSSSQGQGHRTLFAQMVASELGVPFERVRVVQADTHFVEKGVGTFGSRSAVAGGGAIVKASRGLIERAIGLAAEALEASPSDMEWVDGAARVRGAAERTLSLEQIARLAVARATRRGGGEVTADADAAGTGAAASVVDESGAAAGEDWATPEGLSVATTFQVEGPEVVSAGAYVALVSVPRETGRLVVERFVAVDDCGTVINPMLVEGQVHGALAQGFGEALRERMVYDADGQVITGSLMDYALPAATGLPTWVTGSRATPSPLTPLGQKGAGEAGTIGAPPALIAAVLDALAPLGVAHVDMPLTDEQLWRLIRDAEASRERRSARGSNQHAAGLDAARRTC